MRIFGKLCIVLLVAVGFSFAKGKIKSPEVTVDELKNHISYLASEALKGRRTGTEGDSLAAEYIRKELKSIGLVPLHDKGFQHFRVTDKIVTGPANSLNLKGTSLVLNTDFAPFAFSQNESFKGEVVFAGYGFDINEDSLKWNDYSGVDVKGKVALILRADPEIEKNTSPFIKYSKDRDKVLQAKDMGAVAVLLVSGKVFDPEDKFESLSKGDQSVGLPAFRISRKVANSILETKELTIEDLEKQMNEKRTPNSFATGVSVSGHSDVMQTTIPTRNVVMLLPGSDKTLKDQYVVLGAHFDHLGMGGIGSGSRVPDTVAVHYGADDNASGVGMMLELAEKLAANPKSHRRSILVVAFSGEEMGLLGSKKFVENAGIDLNKVNAMINMDMVGRLNENSLLQIGGVGTAEPFKKMVTTANDSTVLKLSLSDEGYGPSDHAAFYGKNIPVLFVSSGAHLDYHTPADTHSKINYDGMTKIAGLNYVVISELANMDSKLVFKEAGPKEVAGRGARRKGVTLGIMPDFAGNVKNGLRADLITPGRPAAIGGMKKGDIITSINGKPVNNIQDYMFRMGQLKHGETINVEIVRDGKKEVLIIQL
ncbi:MAG: M20/M25/M40 family metallo-hydrolase [Prolixibacteraceae bacterium]|nr:M20/M25/M40 family metallo-hydrolase [Prolixibacteraceae bacterium]